MKVLLVDEPKSIVNKKTGEFYGYQATVLCEVSNYGEVSRETQHIKLSEEQYNLLKGKKDIAIEVEFLPIRIDKSHNISKLKL